MKTTKTVTKYRCSLVEESRTQFQWDEKASSPGKVAAIAYDILKDVDREHVLVFFLNLSNEIIGYQVAAIGGSSDVTVSITDLFRGAIVACANGIVLVHNHISGNLQPSKLDIKFTEEIGEAASILGFDLLDHVIVGRKKGYYSFHNDGRINNE